MMKKIIWKRISRSWKFVYNCAIEPRDFRHLKNIENIILSVFWIWSLLYVIFAALHFETFPISIIRNPIYHPLLNKTFYLKNLFLDCTISDPCIPFQATKTDSFCTQGRLINFQFHSNFFFWKPFVLKELSQKFKQTTVRRQDSTR